LADARKRDKSEKKARIIGIGGKEGTWKIDYPTVGPDIRWVNSLSLSLSVVSLQLLSNCSCGQNKGKQKISTRIILLKMTS
jgi:hypothetical protein